MEKIACYIRVSTQEQKLHGISLDAQRDKLKEYAERNNLNIVAWYEDEGISGRKLISKRPALQRMLKDAHSKKFERIIFIKLDRFFRSVAEYHECMKYIDPVIWTATEEKYDLSTANGRAFVNMKLTIAELEADQTGERIKIVNDYKVKSGQALTGSQSQGIAYTVKNIDGIKRVVPDPDTKDIVMDFIHYFLTYQSKRKAYHHISNIYDIKHTYHAYSKLLKDTKLYGHYRGNDNYCEPLIDKKTFDKIQTILKSNIKQPKTNRIYLFTGIVYCPCCKNHLASQVNINPQKREYKGYKCNLAHQSSKCSFIKRPKEKYIEEYLLNNFNNLIKAHIKSCTIQDNQKDIDNTLVLQKINDIKLEMKNTTTAFTKGRISEVDYDNIYERLEYDLEALNKSIEPIKERDLTIYEDIIKGGWIELYKALNEENKRAFWRKFIKRIDFNMDATIKEVLFF